MRVKTECVAFIYIWFYFHAKENLFIWKEGKINDSKYD